MWAEAKLFGNGAATGLLCQLRVEQVNVWQRGDYKRRTTIKISLIAILLTANPTRAAL